MLGHRFGSLYSGGSTVNRLYEVKMNILTASRGKEKYSASNQAVEVCAGDNENKDTCQVSFRNQYILCTFQQLS